MAGSRTKPLSVQEVSRLIKNNISDISGFLEGEVAEVNIKGQKIWLSIKDEDDYILEGVVWQKDRLREQPEQGNKYLFSFKQLDFWKTGKTKIIINNIEMSREGFLDKKRDELVKEIKKFELDKQQKKLILPLNPRCIGLITGEGGMALNDVISSLEQRKQPIHVYSLPTLVQGDNADTDIVNSIKILEEINEVEIILIARGGGSKEDLKVFDSRKVCLKVASTSKPVISAVGHTDDNQLINMVAHSIANTPSRIGEIIFPETGDELSNKIKEAVISSGLILLERIPRYKNNIKIINNNYELISREIESYEKILSPSLLESLINNQVEKINEVLSFNKSEFKYLLENIYNNFSNDLSILEKELSLLRNNFLGVQKDHKPIFSIKTLEVGEDLEIFFSDGTVKSEIKSIINKN